MKNGHIFQIICTEFWQLVVLDQEKRKDNIDKIYLYAKDLSEPKYEYLIKKYEYAGTKND